MFSLVQMDVAKKETLQFLEAGAFLLVFFSAKPEFSTGNYELKTSHKHSFLFIGKAIPIVLCFSSLVSLMLVLDPDRFLASRSLRRASQIPSKAPLRSKVSINIVLWLDSKRSNTFVQFKIGHFF